MALMITIAVSVAAGALFLAHVSREGRDQAAMEDASRSLAGLSDDRLAEARQRCINAIGVERRGAPDPGAANAVLLMGIAAHRELERRRGRYKSARVARAELKGMATSGDSVTA